VKDNPLHLIVVNEIQNKFVNEYIVKKLGLITTPHPHPYNVGWMKE
jgi:hypothetical protein